MPAAVAIRGAPSAAPSAEGSLANAKKAETARLARSRMMTSSGVFTARRNPLNVPLFQQSSRPQSFAYNISRSQG